MKNYKTKVIDMEKVNVYIMNLIEHGFIIHSVVPLDGDNSALILYV